MHGNVWEWVQDCHRNTYADAPIDGRAVTQCDKQMRVIRGGSWDFRPEWVRSAYRGWSEPTTRDSGGGFRLVRVL